MLIGSGFAFILAHGESIYQVPASFVRLGRGADLGGVPNSVLLMAALYLAAHLLMSRTVLGRYIYAIGGNREAARLAGAKLIDVGCMQINHHFHASSFASVEDMLDPSKNVNYAARFLQQLKAREGSWTLAVARYHAGPGNIPAQKRYVCRVITNLVASGFGAWTADARAFCQP